PFRAVVGERHPAVPPRRDDRRWRADADPRPGRIAGRKRDRRVRALLPRLPVRAVGRQDPGGGDRRRAHRDPGRSVSMASASIWLVGAGNMGGAMLRRWIASGMDPARFTVIDPVGLRIPEGVRLVTEAPEGRPDILILAVKPQKLDDLPR